MLSYLLRFASGVSVIVFVAAPGSATVVAKPIPMQVMFAPSERTGPARRVARKVRVAAAQEVVLTGPSGCKASSPNSFVGGGYLNYAGGSAEQGTTFAGVLEGAFNEACDDLTAIGAGEFNTVGGDSTTINSSIGSGTYNGIETARYSFIGSGSGNLIGTASPHVNFADYSTIVTGETNTIGSAYSFIGAGSYNSVIVAGPPIDTNSSASFIGAGFNNVISGNFADIVSGQSNVVAGDDSSIGGGSRNSINAQYGTIAGGYYNVVGGIQAAIAGGHGNIANGRDAAIPGGAYNIASGRNSFAAGYASRATHDGTFVWSDYSATSGIASNSPNQFLARAAGGFYFYSSAGERSGVKLAPGSGSWSSLSDRAAKTDVTNVDDARILAKVVALPVSEWSYTDQGTGVRHLGPMAQDFHAAFGLGEDEKHITTVDEEGVALAAIKALQAEVAAKDWKLNELDAKYVRLEQRLKVLERHK